MPSCIRATSQRSAKVFPGDSEEGLTTIDRERPKGSNNGLSLETKKQLRFVAEKSGSPTMDRIREVGPDRIRHRFHHLRSTVQGIVH